MRLVVDKDSTMVGTILLIVTLADVSVIPGYG